MNTLHLAAALAVSVGLAFGAGCGSSSPSDSLGGVNPGGGGNNGGTGNGGGSGGPGGGYAGGNGSGGGDGGTDAAPAPADAAPALTAQEALAQVGQCMSYAIFKSSGLEYLPQAQTLNAGDCQGCHSKGDGSFWASYGTVNGTDQSMEMFQKTQMMPYLAKYIAPLLQNGQFSDLQASNAITNKSSTAASCDPKTAPGGWCHPLFQLDPTIAAGIDTFVNDAITQWHKGTCAAAASDAGAADAGTD